MDNPNESKARKARKISPEKRRIYNRRHYLKRKRLAEIARMAAGMPAAPVKSYGGRPIPEENKALNEARNAYRANPTPANRDAFRAARSDWWRKVYYPRAAARIAAKRARAATLARMTGAGLEAAKLAKRPGRPPAPSASPAMIRSRLEALAEAAGRLGILIGRQGKIARDLARLIRRADRPARPGSASA